MSDLNNYLTPTDNFTGNLTPVDTLNGIIHTEDVLTGQLGVAGGGAGTDNYNDLSNKPQINNVTLQGNKTTAELNLPDQLGELTDVTLTDLQDSDMLTYVTELGWINRRSANRLSSLEDVNAVNPVGGHALIYNSTQEKWIDTMYNYNNLTSKPTLNNVTISGDKTSADYDLFSGNYNDLTNKPTLATVATSGNYTDLTNTPQFTTVLKNQALTLAANTSGYLQLNEAINFPASNSVLIGFFAYAVLTAATAGTIITAGLIENGAKPYIHYQTGDVGFSNVTFYFRYCFYTPPTT